MPKIVFPAPHALLWLAALGILQACTSAPPTQPAKPMAAISTGGYYKDDGPGDKVPDNLHEVPDAQPRWEPIYIPTTRPYKVLGKSYTPFQRIIPYKRQGIASWYGKKFHGEKTSNGEIYNMFAMTAASTVLAIPSYARVTNLQNGKSVIVRINDRGPFHDDRIIDLSYAAANKLDLITKGSGRVEVESILPEGESYAEVAPPHRQVPTATPVIAVAPPAPPPPATIPPKAEKLASGIYLQLAAFSNMENAENLRSRLHLELDWLGKGSHISEANNVYRLQVGPYATRAEAEAASQRIRQQMGEKPFVVEVR